jgi:4-oxalocrotonate tautomerase
MPTLLLKISPPQTPERYQSLGEALTAITESVLGKRADVTAVMIDALPASQWFIGGTPPTRTTVMLEISITAGTNTADEKARFIQAAFDELQRQLAPGQTLEPASYVIVRELPACDWGYEGQTQLARRNARDSVPLRMTTAPEGAVF